MSDIVVLTKADLDSVIHRAALQAANEAISRLPARNVARPLHVNQKQAAEMLGISHVTVSKLIKAGSLKLNACGLIPIELVDSLAKAN